MKLQPDNLEATLTELFALFPAAFDNCTNSARFAVAGKPFQCKSHYPSYLDRVRRAIASSAMSDGATCRLLVTGNGHGDIPALQWNMAFFREREIEAMLAPTRFRIHYYDDKNFWQVFDRHDRVGIQFMNGPKGAPEWDQGSPLRNFIQWRLMSDHTGLIHAGALGVNGRGVLLAGAGGSGKSGTVIAGILGGLQTVGDDYVHVSVNNGDTLAQPVYTTLKQDPDGLKRLGLSDKEFLPQTVNWQGKYQFNLTDLNPASLTERLQITALVLPKISSRTQSRFRPAQTKEAFLTLAPSGVSQIHGDRDASFALAAKVTRALPCYFMDLSQDPAEISTALRTFIGHQSL